MTTVTTIVQEGAAATALRAHTAGAGTPAVAWGAIFAGAAGAAALSLILLLLGIGLGFSVVSPWSGPSATAMTWGTIIWTCVTSIAAFGLGGYIAGRLRTRWPDAQRDEVYFRDTAHGFLSWAVATLITAAALTSVIGSVLGSGEAAAALGDTRNLVEGTTALSEEQRRDAAIGALWIFVSLLIGAFSASLLATWGGRQRDLP